MAKPKTATGSALLLGMPDMDDEESEDVDVGADREEAAASAFMKAVKGDDPAAVVSAYRELQEACDASYGADSEEG